jgi:hypothetical protein
MPLTGEYEPNPMQFVRDQVELYESSGGTQGTTLNDRPVVILTTLGGKSGKIRKSPLMRVEHDGSYAVEAFPDYAEYQKNTDREIPVLVLEPAAEQH